MTKKVFLIISIFTIVIGLSGCAGASIMDTKITSKQARVIFEVPNTVSLDKVTKGLYEAVSYRVGNLKENENLLPEELPNKAGGPKRSQMFKGLASIAGGDPRFQMMQLDTSEAYYTVSGEGGMDSGFNAQVEYYKAAIYPYKDGYKIFIYMFYQEGSDGIMGSLTNMAVEAIIKERGALLYMAQIRDKFKEEVPLATIKSQSPRKLEKVVLNSIGLAKDTTVK